MASHLIIGLDAILVVFLICICLFAAYMLKKYDVHWLPDSGCAMILGMIAGSFMLLAGSTFDEINEKFDPELFFYILLPPIVFDAGYSMKKRNFFSNFVSILYFAVLGTVVSTLVLGYCLYGLALAGAVPLDTSSPLESLTFGALLSSTDPVATLAILGSSRVNADPTLYALVFGESVLNDAVAIVLFKTFSHYGSEHDSGDFSDTQVLAVIGEFIGVSLGSLAMGVAIALFSAAMFKHTQLRKFPTYEFILMFFFAYSSYCLAEIASLSGIMALFFCGIAMAHYTWYNISKASQRTTKQAFNSFALISETFLFAYLGITAVNNFRTSGDIHWHAGMIFLTLLLLLVSRACNIFPFSAIANLRRKKRITGPMQIFMWFSGLRGAICFALAMNMNWSSNQPYIITTTITVVMVTTIICGGCTTTVIRRLNLSGPGGPGGHEESDAPLMNAAESDSESKPTRSQRAETDLVRSRFSISFPSARDGHSNVAYDALQDERESGRGPVGSLGTGLHGAWRRFDERVMKPVFGGKPRDTQHALAASADLVDRGDSIDSINTSHRRLPRASPSPSQADVDAHFSRELLLRSDTGPSPTDPGYSRPARRANPFDSTRAATSVHSPLAGQDDRYTASLNASSPPTVTPSPSASPPAQPSLSQPARSASAEPLIANQQAQARDAGPYTPPVPAESGGLSREATRAAVNAILEDEALE